MSEHYTGRNGLPEQVRFYRQEPRYIRNLPWDFEQKNKRVRFILAETIITMAVVFGLVYLFFWVYAK